MFNFCHTMTYSPFNHLNYFCWKLCWNFLFFIKKTTQTSFWSKRDVGAFTTLLNDDSIKWWIRSVPQMTEPFTFICLMLKTSARIHIFKLLYYCLYIICYWCHLAKQNSDSQTGKKQRLYFTFNCTYMHQSLLLLMQF